MDALRVLHKIQVFCCITNHNPLTLFQNYNYQSVFSHSNSVFYLLQLFELSLALLLILFCILHNLFYMKFGLINIHNLIVPIHKIVSISNLSNNSASFIDGPSSMRALLFQFDLLVVLCSNNKFTFSC